MSSTSSHDSHHNATTAHVIENTADIGQLVRQQRRQQKLRIDDAAALTHVSVDLFSRLENGKGAVRLDKLLLVLDAMGLCMIVEPKSSPIVQKLLQQKQSIEDAHPFAFLGKAASTLLFGSMDKPTELEISFKSIDLLEV